MLRIKNEKKEDVDTCVVHGESHVVKYFPSLPRLKQVYQEDSGSTQFPMQLCYVALRGPWQPIQPDMVQEPNSQFKAYAHPSQSNWNTPFPWKLLP